ncbi:MAG: hypothetical protein IJ787_07365 [Bacilli bacterium]|nr:hypothetical protein [Bacilli bacterium]
MRNKLFIFLPAILLTACGGGRASVRPSNNASSAAGEYDLTPPSNSFDYGGVKKEDVVRYLEDHNMGAIGNAAVYEETGDMQLSFYYVAREDSFNVVNKTVAKSGGATQTTLSGVAFQWGNIYEGSFLCTIAYVNGSSNYQATVEYTVLSDAFQECPKLGSYYSASVNYGTFPTGLRSSVNNIVSTQWLGLKVAVAYAEKICQQIKDGCHLWGSVMQTSFEQGSAGEKEKFLQYLRSNDDYGDIRFGHKKSRRSGGYVHFWYDPTDDYFTVRTYGTSKTDNDFSIIASWSFRFGSFIRGKREYYAENLIIDFVNGSSYKYVHFSADLIILRSGHTYRINEPVVTSVDDPSWDSSFTKGFGDELKTDAVEIMDYLESEWNAAGMTFKLW